MVSVLKIWINNIIKDVRKKLLCLTEINFVNRREYFIDSEQRFLSTSKNQLNFYSSVSRKTLSALLGGITKNIYQVNHGQEDKVLGNKSKLMIGDGNMAGAIMNRNLAGWIENWRVDILKATAPERKRAGVNQYFFDSIMPPQGAKYDEIWLGYKPTNFSDKSKEDLRKYVTKDTLVVSLMAGITTDSIRDGLGVDMVARVMTNINATDGNAQSCLATSGQIPEKTLDRIVLDLESIGDVHLVFEDRVNSFTAAAGSPAAYQYLFGTMERVLKNRGCSEQKARKIIFDAVIYDPKDASSYTKKVKDALLELELSTEKGKEGRGKGSIEGSIIKAAKILIECSDEEISCFMSGIVARFSRAFIKSIETDLGFSNSMAHTIISGKKGVAIGSALNAEKSGRSFLDLQNSVTSVRGTTEELLKSVVVGAGRGWDELVSEGLKACCEKGNELGNPLKYYLGKTSKHLVGSTDFMLNASQSELVAVHNELKQELMKLQKFDDKKNL